MDINHMHRGVLALLILFLSGILSFLIIPARFPLPSVGLAALFSTISLLAFWAKKKKGIGEIVALLAVLLLSLFLVLRANYFLNFLDILTILFLGSYYLFLPGGIESLLLLLVSPFIALTRIAKHKNNFPITLAVFSFPTLSRFKLVRHVPSILITILLLVIVLPLLSYANPFFQKLVTDVANIFDLTWISKYFTAPLPVYLARLIVFTLLVYLFPRGISQQNEHAGQSYGLKSPPRVNLLIPKFVLAFVFIVFFFTQIELYSGTTESLRAMGYTNSQVTKEVFGQLSLVAFIIFLLVYADRSKSKINNVLTYALILEGVFLCAIAFKSDIDYVAQYGFTSKRLYGYAGVAWVFGLFGLFVCHYHKDLFKTKFITHVVGYSVFIMLCINVINFDYIIYHNDRPRVFGTDFVYLATLSPDADSYKEQLQNLLSLMQTEADSSKRADYLSAAFQLIGKITYLQQKYQSPPIGSYNVAEYTQYQQVKSVNTDSVYQFLGSYKTEVPRPIKAQP